MTEVDILQAVGAGEAADWEFKTARDGFPKSLWETYSAMANSDGGTIVLGVAETNGCFGVSGLPNAMQMVSTFWNGVNNPQLVSACLVASAGVRVVSVDGRDVVAIAVPRATRQQRPVYIRSNPLTGTYRRGYEGDYLCGEGEVRRMLAEQSGQALDAAVLDGFGLDDIDQATLKQYRQLWSSRDPGHPWLADEDRPFLENIGAYRVDRQTGHEGLTIAGLLMFGLNRAILDPDGVPAFGVDYRERVSNDLADRWTDRVTYDGKWECNLLQFLQRVLPRLTADIKTPFRLNENLVRIDDTEVHQAVREALVNARVHADYAGQGGIVIEKFRDRLEFANPGTLLISKEQALRGGVSECRNTGLQRMLGFLGYGERAGSGFSKILRGWRSQNWRSPDIEETTQPDRVRVVLPMVSLVPDDSLRRLRDMFGAQMDELDADEVQALVTADVEWRVSNSRMQRVSSRHPADLTKMLQGLVARGMLEQVGQKRGTRYRLPGSPSVRPISPPRPADASEQSAGASAPMGAGNPQHLGRDSQQSERDSQQLERDSQQLERDSQQIVLDSQQSLDGLPGEELARLRELASRSVPGSHLRRAEMQAIILGLCRGRYLTRHVLAQLVNRSADALRDRFLVPMVRDGLLAYRFPDQPNRPDQAYTTAKR